MIINELNNIEKQGQLKLFQHIQLLKLIISLGLFLTAYFYFTTKAFFIFYTPVLLVFAFSSFIAFVATKFEIELKIIAALSTFCDTLILFVGIYLSHYPFSNFFYWSAPLIIIAYHFCNAKFAGILMILNLMLQFFWTAIVSSNQIKWTLTVENYESIFFINVFSFVLFVLYFYHRVAIARKDYDDKFQQVLSDFKSINSFPVFNPNPIFEYSDKAGYMAKNESARKILANIKPQAHAELVLSAQETSNSKKTVRTKLRIEDKTFQLDNVYAEGQVNVYVADITEVEANSLKAKENEQYAKAIIDAIPGFVSWVNSDLKYLGVNRRMAKFFNLSQEEFIDKDLGTVTESAIQKKEIRSFVKELFESDKIFLQKELEYKYDGITYYSLITINKYNDNQNAVLISIDFTDLKNAEKQVRNEQARAEASAKLASFGEMAAGIAHEINNPLAIISGTLSILDKKLEKIPSDLDVHKYQQRLKNSVDRINKIIRGMKNLARDGQNDPFEFCLVKDIIDDSLTLLAKKCNSLNIELEIGDYDLDLGIECQTVQVSQVLVILINNAIDALMDESNDHGKLKKWIKISVSGSEDQVELSVIDSGFGIPLEHQEKIFQPFYTTKEVGKGTGLGLSLAVKIIKQHNGEFKIDNNSHNTKFDILLPKKQYLLQESS